MIRRQQQNWNSCGENSPAATADGRLDETFISRAAEKTAEEIQVNQDAQDAWDKMLTEVPHYVHAVWNDDMGAAERGCTLQGLVHRVVSLIM